MNQIQNYENMNDKQLNYNQNTKLQKRTQAKFQQIIDIQFYDFQEQFDMAMPDIQNGLQLKFLQQLSQGSDIPKQYADMNDQEFEKSIKKIFDGEAAKIYQQLSQYYELNGLRQLYQYAQKNVLK